MNAHETNVPVKAAENAFWPARESLGANLIELERSQQWRPQGGDAPAAKSLASTTDALVSAYLSANLGNNGVPLKEFMDSFEKTILLTCLRLTLGNQKNASAILGIKPTAMFEKMRKHCINGRRMKLSEKLLAASSLASE